MTLSRALRAAQHAADSGVDAALEAAHAELRQAHGIDLDYLVVTDPALGQLPASPPPGTEARILIAAKLGNTRLIDNMSLRVRR